MKGSRWSERVGEARGVASLKEVHITYEGTKGSRREKGMLPRFIYDTMKRLL